MEGQTVAEAGLERAVHGDERVGERERVLFFLLFTQAREKRRRETRSFLFFRRGGRGKEVGVEDRSGSKFSRAPRGVVVEGQS